MVVRNLRRVSEPNRFRKVAETTFNVCRRALAQVLERVGPTVETGAEHDFVEHRSHIRRRFAVSNDYKRRIDSRTGGAFDGAFLSQRFQFAPEFREKRNRSLLFASVTLRFRRTRRQTTAFKVDVFPTEGQCFRRVAKPGDSAKSDDNAPFLRRASVQKTAVFLHIDITLFRVVDVTSLGNLVERRRLNEAVFASPIPSGANVANRSGAGRFAQSGAPGLTVRRFAVEPVDETPRVVGADRFRFCLRRKEREEAFSARRFIFRRRALPTASFRREIAGPKVADRRRLLHKEQTRFRQPSRKVGPFGKPSFRFLQKNARAVFAEPLHIALEQAKNRVTVPRRRFLVKRRRKENRFPGKRRQLPTARRFVRSFASITSRNFCHRFSSFYSSSSSVVSSASTSSTVRNF